MASQTDLDFWFDPVCPFAWMTSKWVRSVARQRDYTVGWRFISLRQLNAGVDYDSHFPPEYEAQHTAGLRLLRVASSIRDRHGDEAVGPFYEALGTAIFDTEVAPDDADGQARRARRSSSPRSSPDSTCPQSTPTPSTTRPVTPVSRRRPIARWS